MEQLIIVGSGPAAYTAAIYSARAKLNPLVFEGMMAGGIPAGGQLTITSHIENYPGFPEPISGPEPMERMRRQAVNCGARIVTQTVSKVDFQKKPFTVFAGQQSHQAQIVIIATGASARKLNLPGEERLWQRGISACAVCDGGLPVFRNKPVAVVGGGDSAIEEAGYLTKFVGKVYLIHRRDQLRASKIMQDRLLANPKIEVIWDTVATEALGDMFLNGLKLRNVKTGEEKVLDVSGLFYGIGHKPNTEFLEGQIRTDADGYIVTEPGSTRTNIEGVSACGDVCDKRYRQAITAAGSGCKAALDAERYLMEH